MNAKHIINNIKRTIKIGSWPFLISLIGGITAATGNTLVLISVNYIITEITSQAVNHTFDMNQLFTVYMFFLLAIPIYIGGMMLNLRGGLKAAKNFRSKIISNSLRHHEKNVKDGHTANIMSVFTSDVYTIEDFYYQALNYKIIHPLIQGIIAIVVLFSQNYILAIISIVIALLSLTISSRFSKKVQKADEEARSSFDISTKTLSEIIANDEMIRMLNIKEDITSRYHEENMDYANKMIKADSLKEQFNSFNQVFSFLSRSLFLGLGIYLSTTNQLDFGMIFILIPLQSLVTNMFSSFISTWIFLAEVSNASDRAFKIIDLEKEDGRFDKDDLIYNESNPLIAFEDIDFSYVDEKPLFNNFNLDIKPGSTTAFVGESGSGKSTLFQLLLGFYETKDGTITIGNKNIYDHNLASLRNQMVYIEQSAPLFSRTIKENIALGSSSHNVSDEDIIEASKKANIHDFIEALPDGYNTMITDNANVLSGGQRQRIAIARAFMSDAPIIIMDEPTSALDNESEKHIQESLDLLKGSKTVLIAAHRLSTIQDADNIVVLKNGVIQESGTHDLLLNNKQYYYELVNTKLN